MSFTITREKFTRHLAKYGCWSTGLLYLGIGIVAVLSFLKIKDGGADEGSLIAFLNNYVLGKVIVWIIITGSFAYIVWRFIEAYTDPYHYGNNMKGIFTRITIALSTVADILIIYSSFLAILKTDSVDEHGKPIGLRKSVSDIMEYDFGREVIIATGIIVIITSLIQFVYGSSRGYSERIDIKHLSNLKRKSIHALAIYGYFARGVIIGIIGYSFLKAGLTRQPEYSVNTDKAFDFIGDNIGHLYFNLIAAGTISYGLFMMIMGWGYDEDADK